MREGHWVVFDEYVEGTSTVYTSSEYDDELGSADQLAIHCVIDKQNNSGGAGGLQVQIQHSGDSRYWLPKYAGSGEISAASNVPATGTTANLGGYDQGDTPSFNFVRLAITLVSPCTSAHVRISVTGRTR